MNIYRQKAEELLNQVGPKYTPEYLKEVEFQLGIDEAGRGPVFGSMLYSSLWWPIELKEPLGALGFNDSKVLTQQQRQRLLEVLDLLRGKLIFYRTDELTAEFISTSMNNQHAHVNLNLMSHQSALQLCKKALKQGFKITNIYVDTVGDPIRYTNFLRSGLEEFVGTVKNITVQPKADRDHKVVSASSICAKVERDRILQNWKFREGIEFVGELGSGYPGDPKTKEWLQKNKHQVFGYPSLVRFSWNTTTNALQESAKVRMGEKHEEGPLTNFVMFQDRKALHRDLWSIIDK